MRKNFNKNVCIFILLLTFSPIIVNANIICNDGTVSSSCSDCHRGCCSKHGGCSNGYSGSSSGSNGTTNNYSNNNSSSTYNYVPQQPVIQEQPKSTDVSLKEVTVNYENVDVSDSMTYTTKSENVDISASANDEKATIEYNKSANLTIGDNIVNIKVTAENGYVKNYTLNIIREKILSNNKNIKITIDGEEVSFNSFKSEVIYLSNSKDKVDIKYKLEDKNAKAKIIGNKNLKVGQNKIIVKVTAENGEEQNYTIMVEKYGKTEEIILNIVSIIIIIVFFSGIGYFIYRLIKKRENK